MLAPAVFRSRSCAGNGKKLQGKAGCSFFLFRTDWGGVGSSLCSQDKVTPTQATPLLRILRSWASEARNPVCLPPVSHGRYHCLGKKTRVFFWGGGHRLSEHPNKELPLIQPFNHLPEVELSSNFGPQCFLERLSGVGVIAYFCIPTWREKSWGADSWVLVHSFHFRVISPEKTETLKTCHFEIVPVLQLLCEQSFGLKEVWLPPIQHPGATRGEGQLPDRQQPSNLNPAHWDTPPL